MNTFFPMTKLSAALLISMTFAHAQDAEIPRVVRPDPRAAAKTALLQKYDKNKNGKLDSSEVEAIGRDKLRRFDDNKDGKIDSVEFKRLRPGVRRAPAMDRLQKAIARERALADAKQQAKEQTNQK